MKKKEIILLVGKSGSGKDYFVNTFNMKQIVTHTTRPKRVAETNGVDKWFHKTVSTQDASTFVAYTTRGKYHYWCSIDDLDLGDIFIIDVPGVKTLLNNKISKKFFTFKVVYIECSLFKRIKNMLKRKESIKSIISRLIIDHRDFKPIYDYNPIIVRV